MEGDSRLEGVAADVFVDVVRERRGSLLNSALRAAHHLGVVELLRDCDDGLSASALAAALEISEHRLVPLLDVLVAEGLLDQVRVGSECAYRPAQLPEYQHESCGDWDQLAHVIATDVPLPQPGEMLQDYLSYVDARGGEVAPIVWSAVAPETGRLLDIGGGLGAFSRAFLQLHPENTSTVVDLPAVVRLARRDTTGTKPRLKWVVCDVCEFAWKDCYDVALLANLLHLHGEQTCESIVMNASAALRSGGTLVIKDFYMERNRSGPLVGLYFALNMAIYTELGRVHQVTDIERWVARAGLNDIRVVRPAQISDSMIVTARKP